MPANSSESMQLGPNHGPFLNLLLASSKPNKRQLCTSLCNYAGWDEFLKGVREESKMSILGNIIQLLLT